MHLSLLGLYTWTVVLLIIANILPLGVINTLAASNSWNFSGDNTRYDYDTNKISTANSNASLSNPGSTTGSNINLNPKTGLSSSGAASFSAANKEYLTIPSNSSLQTGDIDFEVGAWVNLASVSNQDILSKANEYILGVRSSQISFYTYNGSGWNGIQNTTFGNVSANTWYFIRSWQDAVNKVMYVSVNGTTRSTAYTTSPTAGNSSFNIGKEYIGLYFDGRIDSAYFKKSVSSPAEATALYSAGAGRTYADLTAANGLDSFRSNLTSWWDMNEEEGTRYDAKGTNHLTAAAGQIIAPPTYGAELISNPGFETAGAGGADVFGNWIETTGNGAIASTITAGEFHTGAAAKLTRGATDSTQIVNYFTVTASTVHSFSFWTRGDGTNAGRYSLYDQSHSSFIQSSTSTAVTGTGYSLVSGTFTTPAGCVSAGIVFYPPNTNGGIAYFDDVSVKQITTASINNGGFDDWTTGTNAAVWGESVNGTSTINDETTTPYNKHSARLDIDASNSYAQLGQTILVIGRKYKVSAYMAANSGTPTAMLGDGTDAGSYSTSLTASYALYTGYFTASSTTFYAKRNQAASKSIFIDQVTLESLGPTSDAGIDAGTAIDGNFAAQFNGTNQYLSKASNASLQTGDFDFTFFGWVNLDNKLGINMLNKANEYLLYYDIASDRIVFTLYGGSQVYAGAQVLGSPSTGTWYFVICGYQASSKKIYISTNNGAETLSGAQTGSPAVGTSAFELGKGMNGREDGFGFIKRLLTPTEKTALYNNGKGLKYSQLPDSVKANITLISGNTLNGNFETLSGANNFADWTEATAGGTSTVTDETTIVHSGSHAVKLTIDSTPNIARVWASATPNKRYKVTFWAKTDNATNSVLSIMSAGATTYATQALTTDWTQYTAYVTPVTAAIGLASASASRSIYIDDVVVEEVPLISYWNLDEKSGTRYDSVTSSANNLTDNGTVTQGHGVNYNEGIVAKITDQSGNLNNFTQATLAQRPSYDSLGINGKPSVLFDGVDDKLVKTGDQIGTGDITVFTVIKPRGWGGGNLGQIVNNGQLYLMQGVSKLRVSSDATGTIVDSAASSITALSSYIVAVTRKADGTTNIYINGALSGSADQASGTPAAGSDTYVGNRADGTKGFDGWIGSTQVYGSVLDASSRNQIEKTLGSIYGITVANDTSVTSAPSSIYPNLSTKAPLRYSALTSIANTLDPASTGAIRYQISNDSASDNITSAHWYYHNGSAWTEADKNNSYQSNTVAEINTNLQSFVSTVSPSHNFKWRSFFITDGVDNPSLTSVDMIYVSDTEAPNNPDSNTIVAKDSLGGSTTLTTDHWYNHPTPSFSWSKPTDPVTLEFEQSSGIVGYLIYFGTDNTSNIGLSNGLVTVGAANSAYTWQNTQGETETYTVPASPALVSGQTHYLKVIAVDAAGNAHYDGTSSSYNLFTYKYDTEAPSNVNYVTVSPQGCSTSSEFTMTWNKVAGGNDGIAKYQYNLGKLKDESNNLIITEIPVTDPDQTEYSATVTPYADGDNVFYVRPIDNAGNALDNWQSGVFCKTGFVSIVDGPTVETGPGSIQVIWTSSKTTTGQVEVRDGDTYLEPRGHRDYKLSHAVTVNGLLSDKEYQYRLIWRDEAGNEGESEWYLVNTKEAAKIINPQSKIISPSKALISWQTNYSAISTIIYKYSGGEETIGLPGQATSFSHQLENLNAGKEYTLSIKALTTDSKEFSAGITFSTPPLPAVSNLAYQPNPDKARASYNFSWGTNTETSSVIYYRIKGEGDFKSASSPDMVLDHTISIDNFDDQSSYQFYASGSDQYGNVAKSDTLSFDTPFDSRPPKVSNLTTEIKSQGFGSSQKAQIIVTWETDEPCSSQVEYSQGIQGTDYSFKTKEDSALSTSHAVIVSELEPSKIYHLRAVSKDRAGNLGSSEDTTTITGKSQQSVLDVIINSLQKTLGWMFGVFK